MRHATFALAIVAALGVVTAGSVTSATVALAASLDDERLERARALVEEARPFAKRAGNPDLSTRDKKEARREAHDRLKEARNLYNAHMDDNPSSIESLDEEFCDCASMLFWIRKMASINEFDEEPADEALPEPDVERDEPAPDVDEPEDTPEQPEDDNTAAAPEVSEFDLRAERARRTLEAIRDVERSNPGDAPRLHALYEKYLAEYDDPGLPGYEAACLRLGALADRMRAVCKDDVGADPEAIDEKDTNESQKFVGSLSKMLRSRDVEERRRAARLLSATASSASAFPLCKSLDDDDGEVVKHVTEGLIRVGGARVAKNVRAMYRDADTNDAIAGVNVLWGIGTKSAVDARSVAFELGRFARASDSEVASAALDALSSLGKPAAAGLLEAINSPDVELKIRVMHALADIQYYEGTKTIANYLIQGSRPRTEKLRDAANEVLKKMYPYCVPHLIDLLASRKHRLQTAQTLRDMTNQMLGAKDARRWRKWWNENKPDDAE